MKLKNLVIIFFVLNYFSISPVAQATILNVVFETGFVIVDNDANDLNPEIGVLKFDSIVNGWGAVDYYAKGTFYEIVENTPYFNPPWPDVDPPYGHYLVGTDITIYSTRADTRSSSFYIDKQ